MDKVNTYQKGHPWTKEEDYNWRRGTYYTGVIACYLSTRDTSYLQQSIAWGEAYQWSIPHINPDSKASGANVLTCGQTWLQCYMLKHKKKMIKPLTEHLASTDNKNPTTRPLTWYYEVGVRYVDALYTAPPTLVMLSKVTDDKKYIDWLDSFFWDVYGKLFDNESKLFYRDMHFLTTKTKTGKKVLWSRGNGWAFAGLARILTYLPKDQGNYQRYIAVFKMMANSLKDRQQDNGYWYPNLDDPEDYPFKETSGTGFFTYGFAWGINNGILDRAVYLPVVKKGWSALISAVSEEGKVQWGQKVSNRPNSIKKSDTHEYVSGIFLLAASEMYKLNLNR